ncbi:hypothetical protein LTR16_012050, partial [Cryomyces antarcticus]
KSDFDSALATKGKYVLIYAYEGSISEKAEECVIPTPFYHYGPFLPLRSSLEFSTRHPTTQLTLLPQ